MTILVKKTVADEISFEIDREIESTIKLAEELTYDQQIKLANSYAKLATAYSNDDKAQMNMMVVTGKAEGILNNLLHKKFIKE